MSGPGTAAPERVDFYVLEESSAGGRLQLACRLAEKAYLAEQTVLVWTADPEELATLDELLWTFGDGSFVPHETLARAGAEAEAPVLLSAAAAPAGPIGVLINLASEVPACVSQALRVAEIVDGDEARRRAGRARFRTYRELGLQPQSHHLRSGRL